MGESSAFVTVHNKVSDSIRSPLIAQMGGSPVSSPVTRRFKRASPLELRLKGFTRVSSMECHHDSVLLFLSGTS